MAKIDRHPAGTFCWLELGTTDQNAAKAFYTKLFGWTVEDTPIGPGETYSMFRLNGQHVGAAYKLGKDQPNVPPHWLLYIAVDDADAAAKRVRELGGAILKDPFDVFDVGRMAVLRDPAGAVFAVWQANRHKGFGVKDVNGALCWADLMTSNPAVVRKFYSSLFGWRFEDDKDDDPPSGYIHIKSGEQFIGGMPPRQQNPKAPPHWLPYFAVADVKQSASQAQKLGATAFMPPTHMENVGWLSVMADPQKAVFALFKSDRIQASVP